MTLFYGAFSLNRSSLAVSMPRATLSMPHLIATSDRDCYAVDAEPGLYCFADAFIANRADLLRQLSLGGLSRESLSDSRLILCAYQRWGIACLEKFMGDFSFALYDEQEQQLYLARDFLGHRLLYYYQDKDGHLYFSNTIKFMLEAFPIKKAINPGRVARFTSLVTKPQDDETFYKDVLRVPEGSYIACPLFGKLSIRKYWTVTQVQENPLIFSSSEHYYEYFNALFEEVVKEYVYGCDEVATHLSGGLDSSSVCAMTAKILADEQRQFIAFSHLPSVVRTDSPIPNWNYSDEKFIRSLIEKHPNIQSEIIDYSGSKLFSTEYYSWFEQPPLNPTNMQWMISCVKQAKSHGLSAILSGQGGNFTISWPSNGRKMLPSASLRKLKSKLGNVKRTIKSRLDLTPWKTFSAVHPELAKKENIPALFRLAERYYSSGREREFLFDNATTQYASPVFNGLYHRDGVRHADPTFDRRIVEFCLRIPSSIMMTETDSRLLVRRGLKSILPQEILQRSCRGMQSADWYYSFEKHRPYFHDLLHTWRKSDIASYLDLAELQKSLGEWDFHRVSQSQDVSYRKFSRRYQHKFLRAIEIGLFLDTILS